MLTTFGQALDLLKTGHRVARLGWNGKGMELSLLKGSFNPEPFEHVEPKPEQIHGLDAMLFEADSDVEQVLLPTIAMTTASGALLAGWLASQTDMLADDWVVTYCPEEHFGVEVASDHAADGYAYATADVGEAANAAAAADLGRAVPGSFAELLSGIFGLSDAEFDGRENPEKDAPESTLEAALKNAVESGTGIVAVYSDGTTESVSPEQFFKTIFDKN